MQAREHGVQLVCMRACGSGYLRPRQHAVELRAAMQLQEPGIRNPPNTAPAMREMNATSAMSPTQWPAGCAPKTGSVAGYGMRPASAESCAVWLLLLLLCGCELAAVGAGISAGEGGASSRLRRAAFSSWRLLAVRSHSSSFPARASARASLAAKESAH
jgi:hypothetical protein